jgi:SAM-dependent methyltransferase
MDLRSLKLHFPDRHVRALVVDAAGTHPHDLEGERFERVAQVAAPLVAQAEVRARGRIRAISIDPVHQVMRASLDKGPVPAVFFRGDAYVGLSQLLQPVARAALHEIRPQPLLPAELSPSDPAFWDGLYREGGDGWELGRPAPPLHRYLATLRAPMGSARVLVLGCGRGHEARLCAELGATAVVAVDFSQPAIDAARSQGGAVDYRCRDLFTLPGQPERYDLIVEHCCFCAVLPRRRAEYVQVAAEVLTVGGALIGLFYAHGHPDGPPFSTDSAELHRLFEARFAFEHEEVPNDSVAARQGHEILAALRKR